MNSSQYRTIHAARSLLVDQLGLDRIVPAGTTDAQSAAEMNLTPEQFRAIVEVTHQLWDLMTDDPYPPECDNCGEHLPEAPATGRPRRYCSNACRQAAYRDRQGEGAL